MFLLDTNVISELRKHKPHGAVLAWYRAHEETALYLPSIAIYELQAGAEITRRHDAAKGEELQRWIDFIERALPVLPLDAAGAREAARLMHGKSGDLFEDALIAAIAITNRLTVATRNVKDFRSFPVKTLNPFSFQMG